MALRVHVCQFHVAISEFASALSRGLAGWGVGGPCPRRTDASSILFSVFRCYELMKFIIVVIDFCNPAVVLLSGSCLAPTFNKNINVDSCTCVEGSVRDVCTPLHVMGTYSWLTSSTDNYLKEIYIYIVALVSWWLTWTSVDTVAWLHCWSVVSSEQETHGQVVVYAGCSTYLLHSLISRLYNILVIVCYLF